MTWSSKSDQQQHIHNSYSLIPLNWREVTSRSFLTPPNEAIPVSRCWFSLKNLSWGGTWRDCVCVNQDTGSRRFQQGKEDTTWPAYRRVRFRSKMLLKFRFQKTVTLSVIDNIQYWKNIEYCPMSIWWFRAQTKVWNFQSIIVGHLWLLQIL